MRFIISMNSGFAILLKLWHAGYRYTLFSFFLFFMYKCECIYSVMSQDFDNRFATAFYLCLGFLVIISHPTVLFCFSIFFQVLDRGPINLEEVGRLKKIYACPALHFSKILSLRFGIFLLFFLYVFGLVLIISVFHVISLVSTVQFFWFKCTLRMLWLAMDIIS